jgi:hypothetical protein
LFLPKLVGKWLKNKVLGLYMFIPHVFKVELNWVKDFEKTILWHKILGHFNFQSLFHLNKKNVVVEVI